MNSVQLALLTYSAISAAHALLGSHRGAAATVVSVVMNVACELWVASAADWHQGFTIQGVFFKLNYRMFHRPTTWDWVGIDFGSSAISIKIIVA